VIFADSTGMSPATNLHGLALFGTMTRVFNRAGTYWFKVTWGDSARVVVVPD
jgi:hypothetical protein